MVFYYTIRGGKCRNAHSHVTLTSQDITCYVGRDKHENEDLIKYGWPGDIWFHVEGLSSAHVYFRLDCFASRKGSSTGTNPHVMNLLGKLPIDDLPEESIEDMCQIVKHNSIQGCKMASCKIVYTPHSNLKKTFQMQAGAVTYHDPKMQRFRRCDKDRQRIKELEKTKSPDMHINYYDEMKENERRIIDWKKNLRKNASGSVNANGMSIYDPMLNDLREIKKKSQQQGDEASGLDCGLAALEELNLDTRSRSFDPRRNESENSTTAKDSSDVSHKPNKNLPVWQQEADSRFDRYSSEAERFLHARGYNYDEIEGLEEIRRQDTSVPISNLLSKLWKARAGTDAFTESFDKTDDLWQQIYVSRNEEKDVLEAIYGDDNLAEFGWSNRVGDHNEDSDDNSIDPTQEFPFNCILPVPGYEPPMRYDDPPPLLLEVYVDNNLSYYPYRHPEGAGVEPPVIALVGGGIPHKYLRAITDELRNQAFQRCMDGTTDEGDPQLFDLLQIAGELATDILKKEEEDLAERAREERVERAKKDREAAKKAAELQENRGDDVPVPKLSFHTEADRRAYAQGVVAKGLTSTGTDSGNSFAGSGTETQKKSKKYYGDAGADNLRLINDLFS